MVGCAHVFLGLCMSVGTYVCVSKSVDMSVGMF